MVSDVGVRVGYEEVLQRVVVHLHWRRDELLIFILIVRFGQKEAWDFFVYGDGGAGQALKA